MRLRLAAMYLIAALFVEACSTTYDMTTAPHENHSWAEKQYLTYSDFLAQAEGRTVQIVTTDGRRQRGRITRADADSIGWTDAKDSTRHVLAMSGVQSLDISHNYGFHGLVIGFLVPTIPNILGGGLNVPREGNSSTPDWNGVQITVTEAVLGGVGGMLVGILITHTDHYVTSPKTASP